PGVFVPLAERTGLIHSLGALLLRKVLGGMRELLDSGIDPGVVAVNVSPIQLQSPSFFDEVRMLMAEHALDADRLEIEITETALMGPSIDVVSANVQRLHDMGITIALDDFGTGYSSLTLLKQFPVDILKIDRSFVGSLNTSPEDRKIIRAIIGLGRSLNMRLVGEGVEDEVTAGELHLYGCTYGQGYHYAKPMPFSAVAGYIDDTTVCAPTLMPSGGRSVASSTRA
ncbi:MAG: EAL domain-containing protein, partial [Pseudomonadota bacterium]